MKNDTSAQSPAALASRFQRIGELLHQHAWLWRPIPYKERRPSWIDRAPALAAELVGLKDDQLAVLSTNENALQEMIAQHEPSLTELWSITQLPTWTARLAPTVENHFIRDIPGRKWQQIEAFARAAKPARLPVLDWCGGKGHLGRLLARAWDQPVTTLERDPVLCKQGAALATRTGLPHAFSVADAMSSGAQVLLNGRHGIALHACGELHRTLVRAAVRENSPALDFSPCCYYHQAPAIFEPLSGKSAIELTRDDLRLAVTETVTSSARVVRLRDKEMAWKLGYDSLRRYLTRHDIYAPQKPIPKQWLSLDFSEFCAALAARESLVLPGTVDWDTYEQQGWLRQQETMRLALARIAFRKPIEIYLVLDLAIFLNSHGYEVELGTFCARQLTPRNILISARR